MEPTSEIPPRRYSTGRVPTSLTWFTQEQARRSFRLTLGAASEASSKTCHICTKTLEMRDYGPNNFRHPTGKCFEDSLHHYILRTYRMRHYQADLFVKNQSACMYRDLYGGSCIAWPKRSQVISISSPRHVRENGQASMLLDQSIFDR